MKTLHRWMGALLLALASLGAQAQDADELAVEPAPSARDTRPVQQGGARAGGPTLREVNEAARAGDLARARSMIDEVLQRQPGNARAHLVKAQLALRGDDAATARSALQEAERLAPGLPFAREEQVTRLRQRLERVEARAGRGDRPRTGRDAGGRDGARPAAEGADRLLAGRSGLLIGILVGAVLATVVAVLFFRRRRPGPG